MTEAHPHDDEELCEPGLKLYRQALMDARLRAEDAALAPCLVDLGLLQSSVEDLDWLEPIAPTVVLHRLLRASGDRVANGRRREQLLADAFERLMRIDGRHTVPPDSPAITVLSGSERINRAGTEAMAGVSRELLCIQPTTHHSDGHHGTAQALARNATRPRWTAVAASARSTSTRSAIAHTDASMADRLGVNVRTVRVHIAKLAATPGSESRARLGYLIGQSGIPDQPHRES